MAWLDRGRFSEVWREDFDDAALSPELDHAWGGTDGLDISGGELTLESRRDEGWRAEGLMQWPSGQWAGQGYGLYEGTIRLEEGQGAGPALLLWPGTDRWPGPEVDLVESHDPAREEAFWAVHWRGADGSDQYTTMPMRADWTQPHTVSVAWEPGRLSFHLDGVETGTVTENVPVPAAEGGENLVLGMQVSGSGAFDQPADAVRLHVDSVSYSALDEETDVALTDGDRFAQRGPLDTETQAAPQEAEEPQEEGLPSPEDDHDPEPEAARPPAPSGGTDGEPLVRMAVHVPGSDPAAVAEFEAALGADVDAVHAFGADGIDPTWQLEPEWMGGAGKPIVWSIPFARDADGPEEYRAIAEGSRTEEFRSWAEEILASRSGDGDDIFVRTTWEVGGEWFPWTEVAQQDPDAFKGAWQEFARAFHEVSPRFRMVWDATADRGDVEQFYPGDDAVDVVSQDIYWQRQWQGDDAAAAFEQASSGYDWDLDDMAAFARERGKGIAVSEWAAGGDDAAGFVDGFREWILEQEASGLDVEYATYWNDVDGSGYDGHIGEDGSRWPETTDALRRFFEMSETTTPTTPDPEVPVPPAPVPPDPDPVPPVPPVPEDDDVPVVDTGGGGGGPDADPEEEPEEEPEATPEEPVDWDAVAADVSGWFDLTGEWLPVADLPNGWHAGDPLPDNNGQGGGGGEEPAVVDWNALAEAVNAYYAATGIWAVPPGDWTPPEPTPEDPAGTDWNALAAIAQANFELTGQWFV